MTQKKPTAALDDVAVLHPPLLALCPLLGILANNADKVPLSTLVRPALVLVVLAGFLFFGLWALLRNSHRAGLVASALLFASMWGWNLLELSIASVAPLLRDILSMGAYLGVGALVVLACGAAAAWYWGRPRQAACWTGAALAGLVAMWALVEFVLAPVYGSVSAWFMIGYIALVGLGVRALLLLKMDLRHVTRSANWFSIILLLLYSALILVNSPKGVHGPLPLEQLTAAEPPAPGPDSHPDIYLIALDGYARADVLSRRYGYNNAPFLEAMQQRGFAVAPHSHANYPWPIHSMTAALNLEYLDALRPAGEGASARMCDIVECYHHSRLVSYLKSRGYRAVAFSPGVQSIEPRALVDDKLGPPIAPNELETVFLQGTVAGRVLQAAFYARYRTAAPWPLAFRRARIRYAFETLGELAATESDRPRFVFAHIVIPDPPYLFARDGSWAAPGGPDEFARLYLDQLHYTNRRLVQVTDDILKGARRPAVILIVSTHGPGHTAPPGATTTDPTDRFGNLTLAYFPDAGADRASARLYDDVSLVNVPRILLNRLFGMELALLEDKAFYTAMDSPLVQEPVPIPSPRE